MKLEDFIFIGLIVLLNIGFSLQLVNKEEIQYVRESMKKAPTEIKRKVGVSTVGETLRKIEREAKDAFD